MTVWHDQERDIAITTGYTFSGPEVESAKDFGDPLTFPVVPPSQQNFHLYTKNIRI